MTQGTEASYSDHHTLDNLLEGYQIIGYDWRYKYVNNTVVKQSKYKKEELLGYTMMEKYPGIEETELFHVLTQCMETRFPATMENRFVFPDGTVEWFELSIQPIPEGIFILSIDITHRKRSEEERESYTRALEELIHMTSHKMRQPVTNILGLSSIFAKQHTKEEIEKVVGYLKTSAQSLDNYTRELTYQIHHMKTKANGY